MHRQFTTSFLIPSKVLAVLAVFLPLASSIAQRLGPLEASLLLSAMVRAQLVALLP